MIRSMAAGDAGCTIVGLVSVGQSPSPSLTADVVSVLAGRAEIREAGALDGLSREGIERDHAPACRERTFFTTLRDGTDVLVDRVFIHERVQQAVHVLEKESSIIGILCTGGYNDIESKATLVLPSNLVLGYIRGVRDFGKWGLVMPTEVSLTAMLREFERYEVPVVGKCVPPRGTREEFQLRITGLAGAGISTVLLNCFGYSEMMRQAAKEVLGRPVIRPGTILADAIARLVE